MSAPEHEKLKDHTKNPYHKTLSDRGWVHHSTNHKPSRLSSNPIHDETEHKYTHPDGGRSLVKAVQSHDGKGKTWFHWHEQNNGIMAPSYGETKPGLARTLDHPMNKFNKKDDLKEAIVGIRELLEAHTNDQLKAREKHHGQAIDVARKMMKQRGIDEESELDEGVVGNVAKFISKGVRRHSLSKNIQAQQKETSKETSTLAKRALKAKNPVAREALKDEAYKRNDRSVTLGRRQAALSGGNEFAPSWPKKPKDLGYMGIQESTLDMLEEAKKNVIALIQQGDTFTKSSAGMLNESDADYAVFDHNNEQHSKHYSKEDAMDSLQKHGGKHKHQWMVGSVYRGRIGKMWDHEGTPHSWSDHHGTFMPDGDDLDEENLNELSKDTLKRYVDAAKWSKYSYEHGAKDAADRAESGYGSGYRAKQRAQSNEYSNKAMKRRAGIYTAQSKLDD